jgi:hypothetical protein
MNLQNSAESEQGSETATQDLAAPEIFSSCVGKGGVDWG